MGLLRRVVRVFGWIVAAGCALLLIVDVVAVVIDPEIVPEGEFVGRAVVWLILAAVATGLSLVLGRRRRRERREAELRAAQIATAREWTLRDDALIHTLVVVRDTAAGRLDRHRSLEHHFALRYADEKVVASGPYNLTWWGRVGDGSWAVPATFVAGTGAVGVGMAVGSMIGTNVARSRARTQASRDAAMTWRPVDSGRVHVSNYGFYLCDGLEGFRAFEWQHIHQADIVSTGVVEFSAHTDRGVQTWQLNSDFAELVFAYWSLARHPAHPQWVSGRWYPFDIMRNRALDHGRIVADAVPSAQGQESSHPVIPERS